MTSKWFFCLLAIAVIAVNFCMMPSTSWSRGDSPPDPSAMIDKMDQDGDGQLSAEEFQGPADHFTRMDTDGDGYISAAELEAARPVPPGGDPFAKDDVDGDGKVSKEEFSGPADLFERLDADGDGYITRQESRPPRDQGRQGPPEDAESDQ